MQRTWLFFFFIIIIIFKYYLCPFPSLMDLSIHYSKITLNGCEIRDLTEAHRGSELWFSNPLGLMNPPRVNGTTQPDRAPRSLPWFPFCCSCLQDLRTCSKKLGVH